MWRKALVAIGLFSAYVSAQVVSRSGIHREDMDAMCKPCDKQGWGPFQVLAEQNRHHLKEILETAAADRNVSEGSNQKKLGDVYASCMDTAAIDARGLSPLKPDLDRIAAIRTRADLAPAIMAMERITSPSDSGNAAAVVGPFVFTSARDIKRPKNACRDPSTLLHS
jgi:predicted metalloendopeptidase